MANQYPPTRSQYIESLGKQASAVGAFLGMAASIALVATSGMPINYFTMIASPLALFVGAYVGKEVMSLAGSAYAASTYQHRYRKEFAKSHALAAALAEDPLMANASPRLEEHTLAELPELPPVEPPLLTPPPQRNWTSLFQRGGGYSQQVEEQKLLASPEQKSL